MRRRVFRISFAILLLGAVGFVVWRTESGRKRAMYDAEAPLGMPEEGKIDFRFDLPAPWEAGR